MSQASPIIGPNKSGLTYRQEDNDGKQALLNHHKGAGAPPYAQAGMIWLDDSETPWRLKFYDGADWVRLSDIHPGTNTVMPYLGTQALQVPYFGVDSGTGNDYAVSVVPAFGEYAAGQTILLRAGRSNTGNSTLSVSGLAPVSIRTVDGTHILAGSLVAGGVYILVHNGTYFMLLNPALRNVYLQTVTADYTGSGTFPQAIPIDDTPPQITEGTEAMSVSITPRSSASIMRVRFRAIASATMAASAAVSLFVGMGPSAVAASGVHFSNGGYLLPLDLFYDHAHGGTEPLIYKVRFGGSVVTTRLNGIGTGRVFGGASVAKLIVEEIMV